jgi:hypothetical protein
LRPGGLRFLGHKAPTSGHGVRVNDLDPTAAALPLGACTDDPEAVLSAAVLLVPEAEPVVGVTRARYDRSGRWGVPAHVTVLFPFVPPTEQTPRCMPRSTPRSP